MSQRIAVVMGGRSSEHEISLKSGEQVMKALAEDTPLRVVIGQDGGWTIDGQRHTLGSAIDRLASEASVVFLALHGAFGEDGTIQGLLDMAGLAYTGSGVVGSALAMDKVRAKLVYRSVGLPTPPSRTITRRDWEADSAAVVRAVTDEFGYPCALKVARSGSSVGMHFPASAEAFAEVAGRVMAATDLALAERFVRGRELTCGVLEDPETGRVEALPPTEIVPDPSKYRFFDYEAKYTPGASQEITPARISPALTREVQALAVAAHLAVDARDFSRTDVMLDADERPWILETNTIPGLTAQSLLPQAAAVVGLTFPQLVRRMLRLAAARGGRRA